MPLFRVQIVQTHSYDFVLEAESEEEADDRAESLYDSGNLPGQPDLDHTTEVEQVRRNAPAIRHLPRARAPE